MKRVYAFIFLVFWGINQAPGQETTYDVEFTRVCLIDSIAPDTVNQFWRFTQANNPGGIIQDYEFDLSGPYTPTGTVLPCCSCLTAASDLGEIFPGKPSGSFRWVWLFFGFAGVIGFGWIIGFMAMVLHGKSKRTRIAYFLPMAFLFSYSSLSAQSETRYDIEFTCVCLIDSIAPDTIIQFYRFTQANNPGGIIQDYQYDLSGPYTPTGTVMGCNDYYLGDNPGGSGTAGTLAIWTGANSLGNSSVTESGQVISSSLTGALKLPSGTDAQDPVWSAGMLRYNTTANGIQGYDGTAERYLPWADSDNWTSGYVPYSNGAALTSSTNFFFNGTTARINPTGKIYLRGTTDYGDGNIMVNTSINFGTNVLYFKASAGQKPQIAANGNGIKMNMDNAGGEGNLLIQVNSTNVGFIGGNTIGTNLNTQIGFGAYNIFAPDPGGTGLLIRGADGGGSDQGTSSLSIRGGQPYLTDAIGGAVSITNGRSGNTIGAAHSGYPGIVTFYCVPDSLYTGGAAYKLLEWGGTSENPGLRLLNRLPTTSGIQTLTMESDTIKYRIENIGTISTSTDGSGDIVVAHGMGTTPTSVQVTVTGTTPYVVTVHTIDATNFTVRFYDMTGAAVTSTAVTATWHAKT